MTTPDLATVPATTWHDRLPDDADTAAGPLLLPARAGIHLGTSRDGRPVALPVLGPRGTRVAVLGEPLFGRLTALRLLAAGAYVTADTSRPEPWRWLHQAVRTRLAFTDTARAWPLQRPAPPTVGAGPQALVSDRRHPPPADAATGAWRTVVHVTPSAPPRTGFWHDPDVLLALDRRHAETVGQLRGRQAAAQTAQLTQGEIILFLPTGTEILRPDISPGERELLTPSAKRRT